MDPELEGNLCMLTDALLGVLTGSTRHGHAEAAQKLFNRCLELGAPTAELVKSAEAAIQVAVGEL